MLNQLLPLILSPQIQNQDSLPVFVCVMFSTLRLSHWKPSQFNHKLCATLNDRQKKKTHSIIAILIPQQQMKMIQQKVLSFDNFSFFKGHLFLTELLLLNTSPLLECSGTSFLFVLSAVLYLEIRKGSLPLLHHQSTSFLAKFRIKERIDFVPFLSHSHNPCLFKFI